nr:hypothetical protein [Tanacetum cinerariifolium]
ENVVVAGGAAGVVGPLLARLLVRVDPAVRRELVRVRAPRFRVAVDGPLREQELRVGGDVLAQQRGVLGVEARRDGHGGVQA